MKIQGIIWYPDTIDKLISKHNVDKYEVEEVIMGKNKKIPEFTSYKEMADFWDTHSLADSGTRQNRLSLKLQKTYITATLCL